MRARVLLLAGSAMLQAAACQARQPEPRSRECRPSSNAEPSVLSAEGLAGTYRLKMVATEGARTGQMAEGVLTLQPYDSSLRPFMIGGIRDTAASFVHYGSTDVDVEAVGAVRPGELSSLDRMRPGAVVIQRKGIITLRLGSEANRRDAVRFDGGFTALRVAEATGERFAGSWTSGVRGPQAAGYFCAVKKGGKDGKVAEGP